MAHPLKDLYTVNPLWISTSPFYLPSMQEMHKAYLTLRHICERIMQNIPVKKNINLLFQSLRSWTHLYEADLWPLRTVLGQWEWSALVLSVSVVGLVHAGLSGFKARALTLRLLVWARLIYGPSRARSNSQRQRWEEGSSPALPPCIPAHTRPEWHTFVGCKTPQTHCR